MINFMLELGSRLASERKRVGLQQTEVCEKAGLSVPTLSNYENGKRSPDLALLVRFGELGYDIYYILTGERVGAVHSDLSTDEVIWLEMYRQLRSDDRERLIKMAKSLL